MVVLLLTLKKRRKKIDVIRLLNESNNARRIRVTFPQVCIPRRSLVRIIAEVAVLATHAVPNKLALYQQFCYQPQSSSVATLNEPVAKLFPHLPATI